MVGEAKAMKVNQAKFANLWRAGYGSSMNRVHLGELPWTNIAGLHQVILSDLLDDFNLEGLSETEIDHLNRISHEVKPSPDVSATIERMRQQLVVDALSNGNRLFQFTRPNRQTCAEILSFSPYCQGIMK